MTAVWNRKRRLLPATAAALAVGRQREVRVLGLGLELEDEVQRRGERVVGARERGVRVGENVAVAHGGGDEVGAAAAQRHRLLAVELGPLAPHGGLRAGARNEEREGTHTGTTAVDLDLESSVYLLLMGSHYGVRW